MAEYMINREKKNRDKQKKRKREREGERENKGKKENNIHIYIISMQAYRQIGMQIKGAQADAKSNAHSA